MSISLEDLKNKIDFQEAVLKNELEYNSNMLNKKLIEITEQLKTIKSNYKNGEINYCNPTSLSALKNCIDEIIEINDKIRNSNQNIQRIKWLKEE